MARGTRIGDMADLARIGGPRPLRGTTAPARRAPLAASYALASAALAIASLAVAQRGNPLLAVEYSLGVVAPVGLGLWCLARRRDIAFAGLLIAAAAAWSLTALALADDALLYSVGRLA